jgi:hypothetical protein
MAAGGDDVVLRFLARFATMSEQERDEALDALSPADRDALIALEEARRSTTGVDLLGVLSAGREGLEELSRTADPEDLLAVIELAAREQPELVVQALFAAVVFRHRGDEQAAAVGVLLEQWQRQVGE